MRELKVGESYTGEELSGIMGIEAGAEDRLCAFGNDENLVVAQDEGNDNYKVLAIIPSEKAQEREKIIDALASWVDTQVIAEMVVSHLEEQGDELTLDACKEAWLGTLENIGGGVGIARTSGEAAHL